MGAHIVYHCAPQLPPLLLRWPRRLLWLLLRTLRRCRLLLLLLLLLLDVICHCLLLRFHILLLCLLQCLLPSLHIGRMPRRLLFSWLLRLSRLLLLLLLLLLLILLLHHSLFILSRSKLLLLCRRCLRLISPLLQRFVHQISHSCRARCLCMRLLCLLRRSQGGTLLSICLILLLLRFGAALSWRNIRLLGHVCQAGGLLLCRLCSWQVRLRSAPVLLITTQTPGLSSGGREAATKCLAGTARLPPPPAVGGGNADAALQPVRASIECLDAHKKNSTPTQEASPRAPRGVGPPRRKQRARADPPLASQATSTS